MQLCQDLHRAANVVPTHKADISLILTKCLDSYSLSRNVVGYMGVNANYNVRNDATIRTKLAFST